MKKLSFLKKLGFTLTPIAIATPFIFLSTSCSATSAITTRFISNKQINNEEKIDPSTLITKHNCSNDDLLFGTRAFCNGNYILFIGSNRFTGSNSTMSFFNGSSDLTNRIVSEWFGESFEETSLYQDATRLKIIEHNIDRSFGFAFYIDDFDGRFFDGNNHEYFVTNNADSKGSMIQDVGPFDTWKREGVSIEQTRRYNELYCEYEWDKDKKVKETDYIRHDASAKAYRSFVKRGAAMFPTIAEKREKTFDAADNNKTGLMVIYKDGRLVDILDLPSAPTPDLNIKEDYKDASTVFGAINKYFTKEEEK